MPIVSPRIEARDALSSLPELACRPSARRMLVVEDDLELKPIIESVAHHVAANLRVHWAADVAQAERLLRAERFRVVLADYLLPGLRSGLSLRYECQRLQRNARFAMISATPIRDYLRIAGSDAMPFLAKPFSLGALREFLETLLRETDGGPRRA